MTGWERFILKTSQIIKPDVPALDQVAFQGQHHDEDGVRYVI